MDAELNNSLPPKSDIDQICANTYYTQSLLAQMKYKTATQFNAIKEVREELAVWERGVLHKLRKVFENNG